MSLVSILGVIGINTLKIFVKNDTDIAKFKNVIGAVSQAISQMTNDLIMYPDMEGFQSLTTRYYPDNASVKFGGEDKFRKLFRRKFNIKETEIFANIKKGDFSSPIYVEYSQDIERNTSDKQNIVFEKLSKLQCFSDNKGITFCPPETTKNTDFIYVLVFLNTIKLDKPETYSKNKAVYFKIRYDGKISVPPQIPSNNKGGFLIDCVNGGDASELSQCKVRDRFSDIELIQEHN